jgi:hypothetical protein
MDYTMYDWGKDGVCDVSYLVKTRRCIYCGEKRFLVALGKRRYTHIACSLKNKER